MIHKVPDLGHLTPGANKNAVPLHWRSYMVCPVSNSVFHVLKIVLIPTTPRQRIPTCPLDSLLDICL